MSCSDKVDLPPQSEEDYIQLYMPQAVDGPISKNLVVSDEPQEAIYGAYYGGINYPSSDLKIQFSVDAAVIDSFNNANETNYELLPKESYTLSSTETMIKKGTLGTEPQKVSFITKGEHAMEVLKNYILPISLSSPDLKINPALKTTFFLIRVEPNLDDYTAYDKSNWKVIDFSSEEANGEGPDNGKALFAIDGNPESFWHSQWQGASPGPPHYLVIDMGEEKELHGIITKARLGDNDGKPQDVAMETSLDNITWEPAGELTLPDNDQEQKNFLSGFKQARYFKFIINSSYNASYVHLAELGAF
ncbi:DUF1735 domain-containing protein [Olivibacter ginsenosidimutans]|uniref:DUF1735 domain-containing protein n=1 Tax=Olivibacter ginsenosidimutans TaxID=1176537 RepID=A0ABP9ASM4_9SPHI